MKREFTGRDMAKILIAGFGVVVAVNIIMATLASRSFSGVVVENSYVASQRFNGWLDAARESEKLGWSVTRIHRDRDDGHLTMHTQGFPMGALITAELRRPLGGRETLQVEFVKGGKSRLRSAKPVAPGRWTARVFATSGDLRWTGEVPIE